MNLEHPSKRRLKLKVAAFIYAHRSECVGNASLDEVLELILDRKPTPEELRRALVQLSELREQEQTK